MNLYELVEDEDNIFSIFLGKTSGTKPNDLFKLDIYLFILKRSG